MSSLNLPGIGSCSCSWVRASRSFTTFLTASCYSVCTRPFIALYTWVIILFSLCRSRSHLASTLAFQSTCRIKMSIFLLRHSISTRIQRQHMYHTVCRLRKTLQRLAPFLARDCDGVAAVAHRSPSHCDLSRRCRGSLAALTSSSQRSVGRCALYSLSSSLVLDGLFGDEYSLGRSPNKLCMYWF